MSRKLFAKLQGGVQRIGDLASATRHCTDSLAEFRASAQPHRLLAKRFAAKEAVAKALGTGVPRRGVHWRHLGVINLPSGKPTLELTGGAAARLAEITPPGMRTQIDVTLTDDYPLAQAIVIITAIPQTADGDEMGPA